MEKGFIYKCDSCGNRFITSKKYTFFNSGNAELYMGFDMKGNYKGDVIGVCLNSKPYTYIKEVTTLCNGCKKSLLEKISKSILDIDVEHEEITL